MSLALWIPIVQFFIIGSRLPSQWLGLVDGGTGAQAAQAVLEGGNVFDRSIYIVLILLSAGILMFRAFKWRDLFGQNVALVAFLSFALLSVAWSDYPYVTFKRWFRDLAYYFTILVALSDARPFEAVRTLFRRACFVLITLSIVIIKYYPEMGRQYDTWTGTPGYVGVTTSKNMLGVLCLFSGIFFLWDTLTRWRDRKEQRTRWVILLNFGFIGMTLWLLNLAGSATSTVCLVLGSIVLALAHFKPITVRPALLFASIPVGFSLYAGLAFGFDVDINSVLAKIIGRDGTLTGRTLIWETLLSLDTNPLIGTGYESFWLGSRLQWIWNQGGSINEAHNGYLELYLNLGLVGLCLLCGFLVASYRKIWRHFKGGSSLGCLGLTLWGVMLFYNVTEAAFPTGLLWLTFLPAALSVPKTTVTAVTPSRAPQRLRPTQTRARLANSRLTRSALRRQLLRMNTKEGLHGELGNDHQIAGLRYNRTAVGKSLGKRHEP